MVTHHESGEDLFQGEPAREELLSHPVQHLDADASPRLAELLEGFGRTGFQGRNLARCYEVLMSILTDPDRPVVFMALAGAMIPAGMRKVIRDFIKLHVVDVLVSTGANLYHDIYEALGYRHYLATKEVSDLLLRDHRINRMLDVYCDDQRFTDVDNFIAEFTSTLEPRPYSTREFLHLLGLRLEDEESIVVTAAKEGVPIFCPAISDSSIGIALTAYRAEHKDGEKVASIDVIKDNLEIVSIKRQAPKSAVFSIGGGVPKNYIQQIPPMGEVLGLRLEGHYYGVQITTDDPKWGGLSGCTFEESQSWGKYVKGARFATVYCDATIALPLLLRGILDRKELWYPRRPMRFDFDLTR